MRRRELVALSAGAAALWPLVAQGQQRNARIASVGWMHPGFADSYVAPLTGFRAGLAEEGFVEGKNATIDYRWAEGDYERFPTIAADFLAHNVSAIVALDNANAILSALHATTTIPIIFGTATDPIAMGLVNSFARPSGNATGVTYFSNLLAPKRLELLAQLTAAERIGYLAYSDNSLAPIETADVFQAGHQLNKTVELLSVSTVADLEKVIFEASRSGIGAIQIGSDAFFTSAFPVIAAIALKFRMPLIGGYAEFPKAGGLISYGIDKVDSFRDIGRYLGRVLTGSRISDLPVLQPSKFQLVINLKTASALGLTVPQALLATADEVIE